MISDETVGQSGDLVEVALELGQCLTAIAVALLRHVFVAETQTARIAVDDIGEQQLTSLRIDAALDLVVDF